MTRDQALQDALKLCDALPIQTVAKTLHKEYPNWFASVNAARGALRYRRGAMGDRYRAVSTITQVKLSTIQEGLAKLSASRPKEEPLQMGPGRYLVLSDLHVPHHEPRAVALALQAGIDFKADGIIIDGDFADCYSVSKFNKDPAHIPFPQEMTRCNVVLDMIEECFPKARIVFKLGNHEKRFKDYIRSHAKELAGTKGLTIVEQLDIEERGYQWRQDAPINLGKLFIYHGDELTRGPFSPVLPARSALDKARVSVMIGHHHRTSEMVKGSADGAVHGGWGLGCLCSLYPEYNPTAHLDWNHGFALVEVDDDHSFTVHNKRILNGKVH